MNQPSLILLMAAMVILASGIAGCASTAPSAPATSAASPELTATPAPVKSLSTVEPSQMAIRLADIPTNYALREQHERNLSTMRNWAVNVGWKKGYYTSFEIDGTSPRYLEQAISVYPLENITRIVPETVTMVKNLTTNNYTVEELPLPGIGDTGRAFRVTDIAPDNTGTNADYVIAFVKYDVYEELWTNGTAADYDTLRQVADTAAATIQ
jgi:hypothetical protein